jgi:hypothetical protein
MRVSINYIRQKKSFIIFYRNMDKLNVELLYAQLDKHRQRWGISWHKLTGQAKVNSTIYIQMALGIDPSAEDFAKLRAWLDTWGDRWS